MDYKTIYNILTEIPQFWNRPHSKTQNSKLLSLKQSKSTLLTITNEKKKEKRTKNVGTLIKPFNIVKSNSNPHIGKEGAKTLSVTAGDVIMFHYTMNHGDLKDIVPPSTSIYNPS